MKMYIRMIYHTTETQHLLSIVSIGVSVQEEVRGFSWYSDHISHDSMTHNSKPSRCL